MQPDKFLSAVSRMNGAQVLTKAVKAGGREKTVTVLLIRQRRKTPEDMFVTAKEAVEKLLSCVKNEEAV